MIISDPSRSVRCLPEDIRCDMPAGRIVHEVFDHPLSVAHIDELAHLLQIHRDTVSSILGQCVVLGLLDEYPSQSRFFSITHETPIGNAPVIIILRDNLCFSQQYITHIHALLTTHRTMFQEELRADYERRKHVYARESMVSRRGRGRG